MPCKPATVPAAVNGCDAHMPEHHWPPVGKGSGDFRESEDLPGTHKRQLLR
jgi:hypothetical protein